MSRKDSAFGRYPLIDVDPDESLNFQMDRFVPRSQSHVHWAPGMRENNSSHLEQGNRGSMMSFELFN